MDHFTNNQLNVTELPKVEDLAFSSLHKKYLTQIMLFRGFLVIAFLCLILFLPNRDPLFANHFPIVISVLITFCLLFLVFGYFGFSKKGFALREKDVSYKRGLLFHRITTVPLSRIQHSELVRGPMDRMFGLSSVKIYTAGGSSSDVTIPGLTVEIAENIREFINAKIEEDAVD